jgi:hypothetical protein
LATGELDVVDGHLSKDAMEYRVCAIQCLHNHLLDSWSDISLQEKNALISTFHLLSFQAISLPEGMGEYITLMRGVAIVGMRTIHGNIQSALWVMFGELRAANDISWENILLLWDGQTNLSLDAIMRLKSFCTRPLEIEYQKKLLNIATDPSSSQNVFELYIWWMTLPPRDFQDLVDPKTKVLLSMHAHWVAFAVVMVISVPCGILLGEQQGQFNARGKGFVRWLRSINARIDDEHCIYNACPIMIQDSLDGL